MAIGKTQIRPNQNNYKKYFQISHNEVGYNIMNKILMGILVGILVIYGISVGIFIIYYNWLYANENGFISWLFFGEVIASLKALVWPLFEFNIL